MTGAVVWIIRMPAEQRCRSLRRDARPHADWYQAVANLGNRGRHEHQQYEVDRSWASRAARSAERLTASLLPELALPTQSRHQPSPISPTEPVTLAHKSATRGTSWVEWPVPPHLKLFEGCPGYNAFFDPDSTLQSVLQH